MLCGSDVALGLDAVIAGKRNVCTPFARRASPRVGHAGHRRSARRLLRQLLALPALGDRRRPVLLAQPVARPPGSCSCARARAHRGRADVDSARAPAQGVPHAERRRRSRDAGRHVPRHRRRRACGGGTARGEPGAGRAQVDQLVPARHRQPVLRRRQHRAAPRRPPRAHPRRREPLRVLGGAERARSSARRSPPRSPRSPTRTDRVPRRVTRVAASTVPAADVAVATLWATAYSVAQFDRRGSASST